MVSETPFESGGADGSNSGARVDQRERLPQSIHKSRPVPLHLPPTLHKRDESHRGSPTLEYRTRPARPSSEGVKQSALHETSSRIHDRVSGVCSSDTSVVLHLSIGPPVDGARYGTLHEGDTTYDTRDGLRIY